MNQTELTIIGIGNILMQDEGIGVHVVNLLKNSYTFSPALTLIDGGTTGTDLLPYFEESRKVLLIDAVDFGKEAGYYEILRNDEILTMLTSKISLHHLGLSDVLSFLKIMDIKPETIFLFGIQPADLGLNVNLSDRLQSCMDGIVKKVLTILQEWQFTWIYKDTTQ